MEKCKITAEHATEYKLTVVETKEVEQPPPENLTEDQKNFWMENKRKPTLPSEIYKSWQRTPLPSVGAQQRLSHPKKLMLSLQILPRWRSWLRVTSRIS